MSTFLVISPTIAIYGKNPFWVTRGFFVVVPATYQPSKYSTSYKVIATGKSRITGRGVEYPRDLLGLVPKNSGMQYSNNWVATMSDVDT